MARGNLLRGGGRNYTSQIEGVKELEVKIRELTDAVQGTRAVTTTLAVQDVLGGAAKMIRSQIVARATAQGWPAQIIRSIFTFADPQKDKSKRQRSALIGINKQRTMRRWSAQGGDRRRLTPKGRLSRKLVAIKAGVGQRISESLATMFEFGTSKMRPRPAFRSAVMSARQSALEYVANGYKQIIESFTR